MESDEKELDDEEMMKLDPILSEVFKQRKVITNLVLSRKKNTVDLKTGRIDNIDSAVIISSVCKAVQNLQCFVYNLLQKIPLQYI